VNIENLSRMRAMQYAYQNRGSKVLDAALDARIKAEGEVTFKRVQFDTSFELSRRLDKVADLLDVSRREFLETALVDALDRAEKAFLVTFKEVTGEQFVESV